MNEATVAEAIAGELARHGYGIGPDEYGTDLIGAGVNSVDLVRLLSGLEERYDVEFDGAAVFAGPVTVARLTEVIVAEAARDARNTEG
ncbi:acyl carrier protein [Streptomyces sp. NPDC052114]|uniref:acyl carrier protein n=1 Tax=unclassified Streptomyces TaxID=2593676 RepID=UPI0034374D1A